MQKLLLLLLLTGMTGCGRVATPPVATDTSARATVERETSRLRGLPLREAVQYRTMERRELRAFLGRKIEAEHTPQELRDQGRALAALGLIPAGTDLLAVMLSLYDEQVAAFYVPEERALYSFTGMTWQRAAERMLLAHELVHALQDQHYDLTTWPLKAKDNDDRALAALALLEGDATAVMTEFLAADTEPGRLWEELGPLLGQNTDKLRAAPAYLRELLLFPYTEGLKFVETILAAGGRARLEQVFVNPPRTTEQILHPEQVLRGVEPAAEVTVQMQAGAGRVIANNVVGEFGVRALLTGAVGPFRAQVAAAGWDGDRYVVAEEGSRLTVLWVTRWDSTEDAAEFEEAYGELVRLWEQEALSVARNGVAVTVRRTIVIP